MTKPEQDSHTQEEVSMIYFRHLNNVLRCKHAIATNKINLYIFPDWFTVYVNPKTGEYSDDRYFVTASKKWHEANKDRNPTPVLVSHTEMQKFIRAQIKYDNEWLDELSSAYSEELKEYPGYEPEDTETIKDKYGLTYDYVNESMKSSWDNYQERAIELDRLEKILVQLEDPLLREDMLHRMHRRYTPVQDTDNDLYDDAVSLIARTQTASTSFLQHHLDIGYTKVTLLMKRLEENGIISEGREMQKRTIYITPDGTNRDEPGL